MDAVEFTYCNHLDETAARRVRPIRIWFGATAWYRIPQWLLEAWDIDKGATRDFALASISNWHRAVDA